jgi:hypothetical protein
MEASNEHSLEQSMATVSERNEGEQAAAEEIEIEFDS